MNGISTSRYWLEILLFLLCGFLAIGIPMLPMGLAADSMAFPDLLFCLLSAWVIRRPETAPLLAVVLLCILADTFLMRPIGLWAVLLLSATEGLRALHRVFRDMPFLMEWVYIGGLFIILMLLQNTLLFISFSTVHSFGASVWHIVRTIAVYPVVVAILYWALRIRPVRKNRDPNRVGIVL